MTVSSRARQEIVIWTTATVRGAPKRAAAAATRITPVGTNRSQLQRTTSPSSKSHPTLQPTLISAIKSSHQASSPAVTHQAPDKALNRHARTAKALSTPPSGARPTSAMNPTAASRSRTPQSERLTTCVSTDSASRMTSNHHQGERKASPSRGSSSRRSTASVQSEDGGEEDDDSYIDSEVRSNSSMSVDRPLKSLVWIERPKSRKVEPYQPYIGLLPDRNQRPRTRQAILRPNQTSVTPRAQSRMNQRFN